MSGQTHSSTKNGSDSSITISQDNEKTPEKDGIKHYSFPIVTFLTRGQWFKYQLKAISISNIIVIIFALILLNQLSQQTTVINNASNSAQNILNTLNLKLDLLTQADAIINQLDALNISTLAQVVAIIDQKSKVNMLACPTITLATVSYSISNYIIGPTGCALSGQSYQTINPSSQPTLLSNYANSWSLKCLDNSILNMNIGVSFGSQTLSFGVATNGTMINTIATSPSAQFTATYNQMISCSYGTIISITMQSIVPQSFSGQLSLSIQEFVKL